MFYTYILQSKKNNSYYIGSCKDINARLYLHNGLKVKSTKRYAPWDVVYHEQFEMLSEARHRESQIKSWKKRAMIEKLIKHFKI